MLHLANPTPEQLARFVHGALIVALGVSLAQLSWRLVPEPDSLMPVSEQTPRPSAAAAPRSGLDQVAQLRLFGTITEAATARAPVNVPETRLNLTLTGVFAADEPHEGGAIVADGGGLEAFYLTGSRLPGGAVLSEIYTDRVLLERNGSYETLRLPSDPDTGVEIGQVDQTSGADETVHLPELAEFREAVIANPAKAFDLVSLQPVMAEGRLKGYEVSPGKEQSLFRRSGLRAGDVVTGLNGVSLEQPVQLNEVFQELTSARQLRLTVERGGETHDLTVSLD